MYHVVLHLPTSQNPVSTKMLIRAETCTSVMSVVFHWTFHLITCTCTCIYMYNYTCMHIYVYTCIYMYTCTYTCTCVCASPLSKCKDTKGHINYFLWSLLTCESKYRACCCSTYEGILVVVLVSNAGRNACCCCKDTSNSGWVGGGKEVCDKTEM